jgi:hypothetical protein
MESRALFEHVFSFCDPEFVIHVVRQSSKLVKAYAEEWYLTTLTNRASISIMYNRWSRGSCTWMQQVFTCVGLSPDGTLHFSPNTPHVIEAHDYDRSECGLYWDVDLSTSFNIAHKPYRLLLGLESNESRMEDATVGVDYTVRKRPMTVIHVHGSEDDEYDRVDSFKYFVSIHGMSMHVASFVNHTFSYNASTSITTGWRTTSDTPNLTI